MPLKGGVLGRVPLQWVWRGRPARALWAAWAGHSKEFGLFSKSYWNTVMECYRGIIGSDWKLRKFIEGDKSANGEPSSEVLWWLMVLPATVVEGGRGGSVQSLAVLGFRSPSRAWVWGMKETEKSKTIPRFLVCTAGLLRREDWGEQDCLLQHWNHQEW